MTGVQTCALPISPTPSSASARWASVIASSETATAASVAGLRKLREAGVVGSGEDVVCLTTGHLLKDPAAAATAGADPEPVPDSTDAVLAHLAGEDVSGGLLGRIRGLL